jgi:hypothetical protein
MGDSDAASSGSVFIPDNTIKFGFRIMGVFVNVNSEKTFNGDVTFTAAFNTTGGINYLELGGKAFMGAEIKERSKAPFKVSLLARYDDTQGTFDLNVAMAIKYPMTGTVVIETTQDATLSLHIKEKETIDGNAKWSLCIGTPEVPNQVTFFGKKTWAYFRTGNNLTPNPGFQAATIEGLQSVDPSFVASPQPVSSEAISGKGFDFGIGMKAGGDINTRRFEGKYFFGAEINLALMQSKGTCVTDKINYWYAQGGIAIYANAEVAYRDAVLLQVGLAALIEGGAPEPLWAAGKFKVRAKGRAPGIGRFNINTNLEFDYGERCEI